MWNWSKTDKTDFIKGINRNIMAHIVIQSYLVPKIGHKYVLCVTLIVSGYQGGINFKLK